MMLSNPFQHLARILRSIWQSLTSNKPAENYNAPVSQDNAVRSEDIDQPGDLDNRSLFVDGTSLDFVFWNSYVTFFFVCPGVGQKA
jgi:hypothetical protein